VDTPARERTVAVKSALMPLEGEGANERGHACGRKQKPNFLIDSVTVERPLPFQAHSLFICMCSGKLCSQPQILLTYNCPTLDGLSAEARL
jgi:hypothetical protein